MISGGTAENMPAERDGKHGAAAKTSGFRGSVGQGKLGSGRGWFSVGPVEIEPQSLHESNVGACFQSGLIPQESGQVLDDSDSTNQSLVLFIRSGQELRNKGQ